LLPHSIYVQEVVYLIGTGSQIERSAGKLVSCHINYVAGPQAVGTVIFQEVDRYGPRAAAPYIDVDEAAIECDVGIDCFATCKVGRNNELYVHAALARAIRVTYPLRVVCFQI
jgi:hypothetical protein